MKHSISNKLTGYLAKSMAFSTICILIIALVYSYVSYNKLYKEHQTSLRAFAQSILPATTRDISVNNIEALTIRTEFIVLRERSQSLQIKIVDKSSKAIYTSDGFMDQCKNFTFTTFARKTLICDSTKIDYLGVELGTLSVSKEIDSFYAFLINSNVPALFLILLFLFASVLVTNRYLLKNEIVNPLHQLVQKLQENTIVEGSISGNAYEWNVLDHSIQEYKRKILDYSNQQNETNKALNKEKVISEVTSQLAHDIRSPLAALDMIAANIPELDEEKRVLIRKATARIHNIANNLLDRNLQRNNVASLQMLSSMIKSMVFEKKEQFKANRKITINEYFDPQTYGAFAKIEIHDFKRILSNVIDNAVQAIPGTGFVRIALIQKDGNSIVEIFDNGKGIPPDLIQRVVEKGVSTRKEGSGLGLYFVDQKMKEWGGRLEIESTVDIGTTVRLILKKEETPAWFVSKIVINDDGEYVILDDDYTIHEIWKSRILKSVRKNIKIHHFESEKNFEEWFKEKNPKDRNITYFFDYELVGNKNSGLDIIEKFNISSNAILVTSHYENENIQKRCEKIGVRMIPKELAGFVPILND